MKKFIYLASFLLVFACFSVFAQETIGNGTVVTNGNGTIEPVANTVINGNTAQTDTEKVSTSATSGTVAAPELELVPFFDLSKGADVTSKDPILLKEVAGEDYLFISNADVDAVPAFETKDSATLDAKFYPAFYASKNPKVFKVREAQAQSIRSLAAKNGGRIRLADIINILVQ